MEPILFAPPLVASGVTMAVNALWHLASSGTGNLTELNENLQLLDIAVQRVQQWLDRLGPGQTNIDNLKPFVQYLTKLCYNIEDMIDGLRLAEMKRRCQNRRGKFLNRLLRRGPMRAAYDEQFLIDAHKIILLNLRRWGLPQQINDSLHQLERMEQAVMNQFHNSPSSSGQQNGEVREAMHTANSLLLPAGRMIDRTVIVEMLLTADAVGVSIVGMTGLGKTTLALSILNDAKIKSHFHIILWGSAASGVNNFRTCEFHRAKAHDVEHSQCLVVVDDLQDVVSTNNMVTWEDTFRSMRTQLQSKRVMLLITTRDPRVAWSTQTTPYCLKLMSEEDCGELIRSKVHPKLNSEIDKKYFEQKASQIAQMSLGLPLVAHVIAYTLNALLSRFGSATYAISYFMRSNFWELVGKEIFQDSRFKIPGVRGQNKLLAYFLLFPNGHILKRDGLIQFWLAEGFIQPERWTDWEETAEHQFHEILSASMIQPNNSDNQDLTSYQVFEITRMFAQSIASNMCFRIDSMCFSNDNGGSSSSNFPPTDTRHMSVCCQGIEDTLLVDIIKSCQKLRTFLFLHKEGTSIHNGVPRCLFQKLLVLRVLDLSRSCLISVPESIGNLKHLRYLDLSYTTIRKLPNSSCTLLALRIFKLIGCSQLQYLPKKFSNLVNLIHLDLTLTNLSSLPSKIGKLTNLQTLNKFTVDQNKGYRISELKFMNALRGSIEIVRLENVKDKNEAGKASLCSKSRLTRLELRWTESSMQQLQDATEILNELKPPTDLVELKVTNYNGKQYPWWFNSPSTHNLQNIHLHHWPACDELPPFWTLPVLRTLRLVSMHGLIAVDRHFLGRNHQQCIRRFSSLEYLEFRNMPNLVTWEEMVDGDMPHLKELKIVSCPNLIAMSNLHFLTLLKSVEISNCPRLLIDPDIPLDCDFSFDRSN